MDPHQASTTVMSQEFVIAMPTDPALKLNTTRNQWGGVDDWGLCRHQYGSDNQTIPRIL